MEKTDTDKNPPGIPTDRWRVRKNRLSAHRRAKAGLDYQPPPPPSDADRRRATVGSLLRVARMVILGKIFGGN